MRGVWIFVLLLAVDALTADGEEEKKISGGRAHLLRQAFTQLLRLKSAPTESKNAAGVPLSSAAAPPRYMLDLYQQYRRGEAKPGNTVRSIMAIKGDVNGEQMLLFNLSGINTAAEEVLHCELHFYARRKMKWPQRVKNSANYRMKFFSISSDDVRVDALSTINVTSNRSSAARRAGWRVFNVTRPLTECIQRSRAVGDGSHHHLMAITYQGLTKKSAFVSLPLKSVLKLDNTPFLIVFSDDRDVATDETNRIEKLKEFPKILKDDLNELEQDTNFKNEYSVLVQEPHPLKRYSRSIVESNRIQEIDYGEKQNTLMSWVDNNEYPENSVLPGQDFILQTNPGVLVPRKRNQQKAANRTIPYPTVSSPFGEEKKRVKKKKNPILPSLWQDSVVLNEKKLMTGFANKGSNNNNNNKQADVKAVHGKENEENWCQKKRLLVNFQDLNWGDWIISPPSFEAYYCAGQCSFPLVKKRNPSNHAIIQSIVNALGMKKEVPAPCCVPDAMSSLTLLYFDENHNNVVLKNYPGMVVVSCACR